MTTPTFRIIAFGETLWDRLPTGDVLGGAPFNFAYRVHSLGDGGIMASRLGKDERGRKAREQIAALGMDTSFIQVDAAHSTGTVRILVDADKNLDITILPNVAYDYIEVTEPLLAAAAEADCVCFGVLAQRMPTSRRTLQSLLAASPQSLKLLDINLRRDCFSSETITQSLERADILKLNEEEAQQLAQMFALPTDSLPDFATAMLSRWPLACCVVTLGERGAFARNQAGETVYVPGYRIALVDALGSGDAFSAGFVYRHLRGDSLADCCRYGNLLGAVVATQQGATAPIRPEDIQTLSRAPRISDTRLDRFAIL